MASQYRKLEIGVFFLVTLFWVSASAQAQIEKKSEAAGEQKLIEVLIDEVRQLRQAMERNGTAAFRAQIMVERLRAQQDLVSRINRDLEGLRNQLSDMKAEAPRLAEMIEEIEKKVESGFANPDELKRVKDQAERFKQHEQRMREREIALTAQFNTENARLEDLNRRIDLLEQNLESLPNPDKPKKEPRN